MLPNNITYPAGGVAARLLGLQRHAGRGLGLGYAFAGFINPDMASRALLRHRASYAGGP